MDCGQANLGAFIMERLQQRQRIQLIANGMVAAYDLGIWLRQDKRQAAAANSLRRKNAFALRNPLAKGGSFGS
jgi:hypothetical protein